MIESAYESKISGTNAERLALGNSPGGNFLTFYETDTNSEYEWKGSEWVQKSTGGAKHVTSPQYTFTKYISGNYTYLRDAVMGSAKSASVWRILRVNNTTGDMVYATGTDGMIGSFTCSGTDANVAVPAYTLGA